MLGNLSLRSKIDCGKREAAVYLYINQADNYDILAKSYLPIYNNLVSESTKRVYVYFKAKRATHFFYW
jgi:hypothetical protein